VADEAIQARRLAAARARRARVVDHDRTARDDRHAVERGTRHGLLGAGGHDVDDFGALAVGRRQHLLEALHGAGMQLRHARLVHADLGADLLHRHLAEVVEADDLAFARRQRVDRGAHALADFGGLVHAVGRRRLWRQHHGGEHVLVGHVVRRERRGRLDRVDADDGAIQAGFVRPHAGREVGHRRLAAEFPSQVFASRLQLASHAADAAGPRIAAQGVDHRAPHAAFGKRLELDAAVFVVAVRGIDQADHPVLDQVAKVDRVWHRGGDTPGERLDEGHAGGDAFTLGLGNGLALHGLAPRLVAVGETRCRILRTVEPPGHHGLGSWQARYQLRHPCAVLGHTQRTHLPIRWIQAIFCCAIVCTGVKARQRPRRKASTTWHLGCG